MVLSSPRTLGTSTRRPADRLVPIWLAATIALIVATNAAAQSQTGAARRARVSQDLAQLLQTGDTQPTTVIITAPQGKIDALAAKHGLTIEQRLATGAVLRIPAARLEDVVSDGDVDYLSSNHAVSGQMFVTNQATGADQVQAGLVAAGVPGLTGQGVGVAVIDSGIANVPELRGRLIASVDFTDARGLGLDEHGHGTHVAGIIAAGGTNPNDDTRGIAPGAHLISLKVLDAQGRGKVASVIAALDWAVLNSQKYGIKVINLSLGGPVLQSWRDDPLCQAVERAFRAGIVVVASSGNFGKIGRAHV